MNVPTVRQLDVLAAVRSHQREYGFAPSMREIALLLDIASTAGVRQHCVLLAKKGLVSWTPRLARTLALTDAGAKVLQSQRPSEV